MHVVLVLNRTGAQDLRITVRLHTRKLKTQVIDLLEDGKGRDAFELMLREAEVVDYLPPGAKPAIQPDMVVMEDLL